MGAFARPVNYSLTNRRFEVLLKGNLRIARSDNNSWEALKRAYVGDF